MLPAKFQVNIGLLVQEKKQKIDFQDSGHFKISDQIDFSYF